MGGYSKYSHDQFQELKQMIEELVEVQHTLPSWPMQFVGTMKAYLARDGRDLELTSKQEEKLRELHASYCDEDKQQDTADRFENGKVLPFRRGR